MINILKTLKSCFNYIFVRDTWSLGYRFNKAEVLPLDAHKVFTIIKPNIRWWFADPFCIKYADQYYIFCEMLDCYNGIGSIGVIDITDGKAGKVKQVIKEDFHMSYPNVFQYNDSVYMIPETRKGRQIRLYKAVEFPYKWELDTVLLDNIEAVDSTILTNDNTEYLFTYDVSNDHTLRIYEIDMKNKKVCRDSYIEIPDRNMNLRPAGNFFRYEKKIIRPSQFNKNSYGERLIFSSVIDISDKGYQENEVCSLSASQVKTNTNMVFSRIHTINKADDMEVVDLLYSKFCIYKPFLLFVRVINKIRKNL